MARMNIGSDVFRAGYERLYGLYKGGHRLVVCFSGGKDSTVCVELAIMAARDAGRLPVEVVCQDEEIAYPGTYEFMERTGNRKEVKMTWLVMQQPMVNIFNRETPYFWCHDPMLDPNDWVRRPPAMGEFVEDKAIELMVNPLRFPVVARPQRRDWGEDNDPKLVAVIGLRTSESSKRLMGLHSSGGYMTGSNDLGVFNTRPIYDWQDGDVWKFIHETKCDYNRAYDTMRLMGIPKQRLRIGPPTMNAAGIDALTIASRAWPQWFDKVCKRLPGVRTAAQFGKRSVEPFRRYGETWEQCFIRECITEAPPWIAERATTLMTHILKTHSRHSTTPLPESKICTLCALNGSWRHMAHNVWGGDPYVAKTAGVLPLIEPEFFRPGAGTWAGAFKKEFGDRKIKVMF